MKRILLILMFLVLAVPSYSQCVVEIVDVKEDVDRGSIIVESRYTLNGVIQEHLGRTRYTEESASTYQELINLIKEDVKTHCENLIRRIGVNSSYLQGKIKDRQSELSQPIINQIRSLLIGQSREIVEAKDIFKGKQIKVTYDSQNTYTDVP